MTVTINLPPDLQETLEHQAAECGQDISTFLLDVVREGLARQEVERLASQIDWAQARQTLRPPQKWFDGDEPKPF